MTAVKNGVSSSIVTKATQMCTHRSMNSGVTNAHTVPESRIRHALSKTLQYLSKEDISDVYLMFSALPSGYGLKQTTKLLAALGSLRCDKHTIIAALLLALFGTNPMKLRRSFLRQRVHDSTIAIIEEKLWMDQLPAKFTDLEDANAKVLREYILVSLEEPRAVVLKLTEVLLKMRAVSDFPPYRQQIEALEVLQIYSPLAKATGAGRLLWELEDISFRVLFPESYRSIEAWHREAWRKGSSILSESKEKLLDALRKNDLLARYVQSFSITSRTKNLFSTFRKVVRGKRREEILDVYAMRVIIQISEQEKRNAKDWFDRLALKCCLEVMSCVTSLWPEMEGRYKNYIENPKHGNGYQSIHTTVSHPGGIPIEFQIRTEEMHFAAEYGSAAHHLYKGDVSVEDEVVKFAHGVQLENISFLSAQIPADGNQSPKGT
eukprot:CAMPEP_0182442770 /NCGR_PEP_ID=MMETSP1172-20130603/1652_1 /TAXON_ID=708627 /ORGANISM="Timspurckia oligopyrenoides, Strain CCMP3278" /LENGTH=433 /DNA_ID=CAMNT_0024637793 /DNA_START=97 /DNA_END=1398 /DNA_ORIENTATION=-